MLRQNNNKSEVLVFSDNTTLESALPADGTVITSTNCPTGVVMIVDEGNRRLGALPATGVKFRFVQGLGASKPLYKSSFVTVGDYTLLSRAHRAENVQISTIGYNDTTGSLPSANSTGYFVKIRKNDNDAANRSQPTDIFFQYTTDATATQKELAFGLLANAIKNVKKEPANGYARIEVTGDHTATVAHAGSPVVVKFEKGSKTATFLTGALAADTGNATDGDIVSVPSTNIRSFVFAADALGSSSGNHIITIGDTSYTVADAGTDAQNATAIAAAINAGTQAYCSVSSATVTIQYKPGFYCAPPFVWEDNGNTALAITVASGDDTAPTLYEVDGTVSGAATFTLKQAFQGETCHVEVGIDEDYMTGTATVTNFGLKITGKAADFDVAANRATYTNRFTPTFSDTATTVTLIQGAREGSGNWRKVAMDEYFSQWGNEGSDTMRDTPPIARYQAVTGAQRFGAVTLSLTDTSPSFLSNSATPSTITIYCALDNTAPLGDLLASGAGAELIEVVLLAGGDDGALDEV